MDLLRLIALDEEDLSIVSAHLQDGVLKASDLAFLPQERRFALAVRRYDWQNSDTPRRRLAAMHFEHVEQCQMLNFDPASEEALNLLAITFIPGEAPSGHVMLIFAGDRAVRLKVECLEAQMKDLGPVWEVQSRPKHEET